MHAVGSPWVPMAPGASLEPAVAALRGRFQTKALMSARTAKTKHLILESLSRPAAMGNGPPRPANLDIALARVACRGAACSSSTAAQGRDENGNVPQPCTGSTHEPTGV
eukprot:scaffold36282_cov179-Isochrysis_galbana.AAC.1